MKELIQMFVTQSSFGHRQQFDWFIVGRKSRRFLQSSQDLSVLQRKSSRISVEAHTFLLIFSFWGLFVFMGQLETQDFSTWSLMKERFGIFILNLTVSFQVKLDELSAFHSQKCVKSNVIESSAVKETKSYDLQHPCRVC